MREIFPGVFHWSTFHEPIGTDVSSYLVAPAGIVIDPKWTDEELPAAPQQVVLTIGLHHRDAKRFGLPVRAPREAAERLAGRLEFEPYGDGDEIARKDGLKEAFRGLLTRDFEHLLFAHGDPLIGGGKAALRDFLA
jgi:hypothetical protein